MVFNGVRSCDSLDVFFIDASGTCRQMKTALKMPFSQFCFKCGVCDGVSALQFFVQFVA